MFFLVTHIALSRSVSIKTEATAWLFSAIPKPSITVTAIRDWNFSFQRPDYFGPGIGISQNHYVDNCYAPAGMWNHSLQNDNYTPVRNIFLSLLALDSSVIINLRLIGSQARVWLCCICVCVCVWTYTYICNQLNWCCGTSCHQKTELSSAELWYKWVSAKRLEM